MLSFIYWLFYVYINADDKIWPITINLDSLRFTDIYGRTKIFHGTNVVDKSINIPWKLFVEKDFEIVRNYGYNIIRLGIIWEGIMPLNRTIDYNYLNELKHVAEKAKQYGIYILLDMHQDLMSSAFCGDGAPKWLFLNRTYIKSFPFPLKFKPFERKKDGTVVNGCAEFQWGTYYFTNAVGEAAEDLLTNRPPLHLRDLFIEAWIAVVKVFKDVPNVIGYDLLNEPFPGNVYRKPLDFIPTYANRKILEFYRFLHEEIRKYDQNKLLFIEPVTWTSITTGFTTIPGGHEYANRTVLNLHYYKPPLFSFRYLMENMHHEIHNKLKIGIIMSEFMAVFNEASLNETMDIADEYFLSWIGWQYFIEKESWINHTWVRIYPMTVAGTLQSFKYDRQSKNFTMKYTIDHSVTLNATEVACPNVYYASPVIKVESKCRLSWKFINSVILELVHSECQNGEIVHLQIFN